MIGRLATDFHPARRDEPRFAAARRRGLGSRLLDLGLGERLGANFAGTLQAPAFNETRDAEYGARNVRSVADLARRQAGRLGELLDRGHFPLVLGGDDTVLLGCLLGLRRRGFATPRWTCAT